jgi:hypothetical protein
MTQRKAEGWLRNNDCPEDKVMQIRNFCKHMNFQYIYKQMHLQNTILNKFKLLTL